MIVLASDHAAVELKEEIKKLLDEMKLEYRDLGPGPGEKRDYPVSGYRAAVEVASGKADRGIIMCGTGVGISLAANKVKGIRCVICSDCYSAEYSRRHNDTNMLSMGARVVGPELAKMIARIWLEAPFEGGRHAERVAMLARIESGESL